MDEENMAVYERPAKRPRVLVACQRCKNRRQKCDNSSPACSNCEKAKVPCIYSDQAYPSSYVKRLEERVRQLEANLATDNGSSIQAPNTGNIPPRPPGNLPTTAQFESPAPSRSPEITEVASGTERSGQLALGLGVLSSCAGAEPHYFGFSAGLSLAHFVQVAIDSGGNCADVSLPQLADRPFSHQVPKANTTLADPPTYNAGASYIRAYLTLVYPLYPFLNLERLWQLHRSITKRRGGQETANTDQIDLTIMHLVYAIGSRCLQLRQKSSIPSTVSEGHFLRAMELIRQELKFTSTKSIEVTLLLAIHSMRSPYDRQIIDVDQYRKRLFWSAYIFERKTALVLGRPFALSDEEIDLDMPANTDDGDHNTTADERQQHSPDHRSQYKTVLRFHRQHIQLYQIHSEIRLALSRMKKTPSREGLRMTMSKLLQQLDHWKRHVLTTFREDISEGPDISKTLTDSFGEQDTADSESSSSETPQHQGIVNRPVEIEKNELLLEYHKARRSLLQPLMTENCHNYPFETADYAACAESSGQICRLYRRLHRLSPIPFSLRDLHAVFLAGFTLIYCIRVCPSIYSVERIGDVGACSTVLYVITEQWSSAKKYRDAFETIAEKMLDSVKREHLGGQSNEGSSSRESHCATAVNSSRLRQPHLSHEVDGRVHMASNYIERNEYDARSESLEHCETRRRVSEEVPAQSPLELTQPTSLHPGGDRYTDATNFVPLVHQSIDLDLDRDISDIEKLLSSEGLEWFTGAVLLHIHTDILMEAFDLVITNGVCVTASDVGAYDVAIKDGRIALLAPSGSLAETNALRIIDSEGAYVTPGGVDCHVHLQEPAMFGKGSSSDTFETGTRSAIAGGCTTIVCFAPQQRHEPSLLKPLAEAQEKARGNTYCDYGFHLLVSNPTEMALSELGMLRAEGVTSLKIYMTYEALQLRDDQILSVLHHARNNHILTMIHAENGDILNWLTDQLEASKLFAPKYHATSRPPVLEAEATNRAIVLSSLIANTPILLVHISDPDATYRIRQAQTAGQPIFAETCPQYLFLTHKDLDAPGFEGAKYVCSPPPRDEASQDVIWEGIRNGTFTILSSDHCPFSYNDTEKGKKACITHDHPVGKFRHIPNGIPRVETRLPLVFSANRLPLTKFVEVTSTNAAKLYGLYPKKGAMMPGVSDADLVIWYPNEKQPNITIRNESLHHANDYTPYEGKPVKNWPRYTILRGKVVWDNGVLNLAAHIPAESSAQQLVSTFFLQHARKVFHLPWQHTTLLSTVPTMPAMRRSLQPPAQDEAYFTEEHDPISYFITAIKDNKRRKKELHAMAIEIGKTL
ncbi:transcription activator acu-15 [Fusarium beomiforme]|uniref:Transcription activator acu-15 n=1 Tax=Fusarium beomiforme TaxID=44412 RepID=A0A9P5ASS4_9HYPO|nr:transcription activator acu-15 [Fusarium beomiforme]